VIAAYLKKYTAAQRKTQLKEAANREVKE